VALGRAWVVLLSPLAGAARAMNLLSALATAAAGALTAWLVTREARARRDAAWGAVAGALAAGFMATAWANATETEVYAISLLLVTALLACGARAGRDRGPAARPWLLCIAYLTMLAPAVHLSALVGVPAAIVLGARTHDSGWRMPRLLFLAGALVLSAGVGRVSAWLVPVGAALMLAAFALRARREGALPARDRLALAVSLVLPALATSALLIMLVRARLDPPLNQGNPASLSALLDVVARRQYDLAPLLPRQAPAWIQLAAITQYADWQVALAWGRAIHTSPARVGAALLFVLLGVLGARTLRRDARHLTDALLVLLVCGTVGVAAYLNLKAGSSLGWGVLPDSTPHEARERDYFFVLGFWAWGSLAGYGALAIVRARRWPAPAAVAVAILPLMGNWRAVDRSHEPQATAAHTVATALLASAPRNAVMFTAGDNDSYPLWYAQQVEGQRPDVTLVTLSLLPAEWYQEELARRTGLRWRNEPVAGARLRHEQVAAQLSAAARGAGRSIAATPGVTSGERALLGSDWSLSGVVYRSASAAGIGSELAVVDTAASLPWVARAPAFPPDDARAVDGVVGSMLTLLACPRLAARWTGLLSDRDSLEVKCNLR
jgi:hypothetical protein